VVEISPNIVISNVAISPPITPFVILPSKIDIAVLTPTLPSKIQKIR